MKISLWYIGKNKHAYIDEGIKMFSKRLEHYCRFDVRLFKPVKNSENLPRNTLIQQEGLMLIKELKSGDRLILLDENGKEFNSRKFADYIQNHRLQSSKHLIFAIGGAYGFSDEIKAKATGKVSLSKMTFSLSLIHI